MKAMKEILRRTWAEIDLDALAADFQAVRACAGEGAQLCCVIKADAYGHGAVRMAREFEALGADWLAGAGAGVHPGGGGRSLGPV